MPDAPQTHYLNAEFDLGLRARSQRLEQPRLIRQVSELSVQALLAAEPGDAVLVRTEVPDEFLEHLGTCGVTVPRLLVHPQIDPTLRLRPFGWSAEAIELNRRHDRPAEHPSLATVKRVNARSFLLELEADLDPQDPPGVVIESRAELEAFLTRAASASEWLIKAEHGNAGLGNRRVRQPQLTTADRGFVDEIFSEDDRLVVEPWRARERDWCVVFDVPFVASTLRVHETLYTRDGALIGALFEPGGPRTVDRSEELAGVAEGVASRLDREGYFGPACFDAFSWRDTKRVRFRALADLNCRLSMSNGAHHFWRRRNADRTLYYRFFNRRKFSLPTDLSQGLAALGRQRYAASRRHGILLLSPLHFAKLAVAFVAENRADVFALEREFRARFES